MRALTAVALLSAVVSQISGTTPPTTSQSSEDNSKQVDQYTTEMISNDKIRDVYVKCLLDKGPCNADAADVKSQYSKIRHFSTLVLLILLCLDLDYRYFNH